jgi:hypothetical protein
MQICNAAGSQQEAISLLCSPLEFERKLRMPLFLQFAFSTAPKKGAVFLAAFDSVEQPTAGFSGKQILYTFFSEALEVLSGHRKHCQETRGVLAVLQGK